MTALELAGQAWQHRAKILLVVAVGLLALTKRQHEAISDLRAQLAAKPLVQERLVTRTVQAPTRIVKQIVEKPGAERIVTVEVLKGAWSSETSSEHAETPACPAPARPPRWVVGGSLDPADPRSGQLLRAGVTFGGRLDLTYGHSLSGPARHAVDLAVRF